MTQLDQADSMAKWIGNERVRMQHFRKRFRQQERANKYERERAANLKS